MIIDEDILKPCKLPVCTCLWFACMSLVCMQQQPTVDVLIYIDCIVSDFDVSASDPPDLLASENAPVEQTAPDVT